MPLACVGTAPAGVAVAGAANDETVGEAVAVAAEATGVVDKVDADVEAPARLALEAVREEVSSIRAGEAAAVGPGLVSGEVTLVER